MTGGDFELVGGFWGVATPHTPSRVPSLIDMILQADPDGASQFPPP